MRWILRDQKGTTLIEMVIVGVVIGLISAMAIPKWLEVLPRIRAKSEIRSMVSALREARSMAISTKQSHGVNFDYRNNSYTIFHNSDNPEQADFTSSDTVMATKELAHNVNICFDTFGNGTIVFSSDGSASATGSICIATDDFSDFYSLNILAATGRIKAAEGYPEN